MRFIYSVLVFISVICIGCYSLSRTTNSRNNISCLESFNSNWLLNKNDVSNKVYRAIKSILNKKYGSIDIKVLYYINSKDIYYCEFHTDAFTRYCVFVDRKWRIVELDQIYYDY